uniref:Uncharacterized protein n=1 Tax=Triatoma infestans TaxID=30076 RepID=A0A023EZS6_TRIIF
MERGKGSSGRGGKSKTPQFPADLFALGSKNANEGKQRPGTHTASKLGSSHSTADRDRKRDGGPLSSVQSKKAKLNPGLLGRSSITSSSSSSSSSSSGPSPSVSDAWESLAVEVDSPDFVANIMDAIVNDDTDKAIGMVCGAVKTLRGQRFKVDSVLYEGLSYVATLKKSLFTNDAIVNALCALLKRDIPPPSASSFKNIIPKTNIIVSLLSISILTRAFQDVKRWPDILMKVYLEDAGGDRNWVDHELSKNFVENILASLNTKAISVNLPDPTTGRPEPPEEDAALMLRAGLTEGERVDTEPPVPRFRGNRDLIEGFVVDTVKEQLTRRLSSDLINRNFLKMLTALCGVGEVRLAVAPRLEAWLQNPKLMRSAQELLMSLCVNCTSHTIKDVEVISCLIKMRLKTKALSNYYLSCIRELATAHPDNLGTVLKHTIYNELSTSRNPNNMSMLSVIFQCDPDRAPAYLADIFLELVLNREDYLRPLRALLREMARVLRHELKLTLFCRGLMSHSEQLPREVDPSRAFSSIIDIIALCIFLAVMPHARSEKKDPSQIEKMQVTISDIQKDTVGWLRYTALSVYKLNNVDFAHALHKVLLLESVDHYCKTDNWPPEQDRAIFMRMGSDVPVNETTVVTLLAVGLSKEHPLSPSDALDLVLEIVKRAAAISSPLIPVLKIENEKIVDLLFNLCAYRHPDNIDLPAGYKPPSLAISTLYWKGWTLLLILSSHNPAKFGAITWDKYPTLRVLMEMCITSHFVFPPGFDDLQILALEKQGIIEFESHLAAASTKMEITEQTSLLLSQLITLDPLGAPRRPPPATVEAIKALNTPLRLGHLLCRSRNPDFLLDIIHRQGASQSMPWLADLVHNSDGALNHLPVQCLCEFLLSSGHKQEGKYQQLLSHLQNILTDPGQDPINACEVLDYFLRRLSSPNNRSLAITGLKLVISPIIDEEDIEKNVGDSKEDPSWLTKQLPMLPHFSTARPQVVASLRSACLVENEPELVTAYLVFLAKHATGDLNEMADLVLDMAQLIVERSTIMASILPVSRANGEGVTTIPALDAFLVIFYNYLAKAREPRKERYTWSESQDQVLVSWPSGEECTVHILVIHAMVILLTYGPNTVSSIAEYNHLLDIWFPEDVSRTPKGFLVDTSEEALLIPDWLKLRMIRSHVPRLVEAALMDLDIAQLILFIQSFGIPIASMSKLLSTLDCEVMNDEQAVREAVIDKVYMVQLVEVQHKRGAVGGETFTRVLEVRSNEEVNKVAPPEEEIVPVKKVKRERPARLQERTYMSEQEGIATLEQLFVIHNDSSSIKSNRILFTNLQRTLVHEIRSREGGATSSNFVIEIIRYLLTRVASDRSFVSAILSWPQYSCPLFRLLATIAPNSRSLTLLAKDILQAKTDNPRIKSLVDILTQYVNKQENQSSVCEVQEKMDTEDSLTETMKKLLICPDSEAGHLVDKLVKLEPEILGSEIELQMKLLFCSRQVSSLQCRPYLLTLLTHHASWKTLYRCVELLLEKNAVRHYEPTPVLDFLKALTCNPKLWQGREKHTPKHYEPEDVLYLNLDQLKVLAEYIVAEGVIFEDGDQVDENNVGYQLSNRLTLLNQCICATDIEYAAQIAKHIIGKIISPDTSINEADMCKQLLVKLYLKIPSLITHLSETEVNKTLLKCSELSVGGCSTMDIMSHTLITALAATPNQKDWNKKAMELDLAVRKMAATHPLLVLRQLPLIASSLRGRVDLDWSVFKYRSHLLLFQQVFALLDLLQPTIFKPSYTASLQKILDVYLELFQNYAKEGGAPVSALVTQFVAFMQCYIRKSIQRARIYLQIQADIISDLTEEFPLVGTLCVVITRPNACSEIIVTPSQTNLVESPNPQWDAKITQLYKENDPYNALTFFDYNTLKKPSQLEPMFPKLCTLLTCGSSQIRTLAHTLVNRYLRYSPSSALIAIPAYMTCLDSSNPDVITATFEYLPEVILAGQEKSQPLLQKLFSLGINNYISTSACISKTIALLNQQSAC